MAYTQLASLLAVAASATILAAEQSAPAFNDVQNAFRSIDAAVAKHDHRAFADALADSFTFLGIDGELIDRSAAIESRRRANSSLALPTKSSKLRFTAIRQSSRIRRRFH